MSIEDIRQLKHAEPFSPFNNYLPMLKYGTQLPAPSQVRNMPPQPPPVPPTLLSAQRVSVVDFDIPFGSVLKIMFKWDGSSVHRGLLFPSTNLRSMADRHDDIRRAN